MTHEELIDLMTNDAHVMIDRIKEKMKLYPYEQQFEYLKDIRYLMVEIFLEINHVKNSN